MRKVMPFAGAAVFVLLVILSAFFPFAAGATEASSVVVRAGYLSVGMIALALAAALLSVRKKWSLWAALAAAVGLIGMIAWNAAGVNALTAAGNVVSLKAGFYLSLVGFCGLLVFDVARAATVMHVVKRAAVSAPRAFLIRLSGVLLALITGGIFFLMRGFNPFEVYADLIVGALGTEQMVQMVVRDTVPLLITSLGVTLAFRMRFWNIGAEGQIGVGAIAASYFALFHSDWPQGVLLVVMALAAFIAGGLYGLIPAYFKVKFGTNETLFTLMLNYVAMYTIKTLAQTIWRDPAAKGMEQTARFAASARLPQVFGVHIGWIIAVVLVFALFVYMGRFKGGYELSVVGENENTARYAGMNVKKIVLRTMFLSAAVCGLVGMLQASGADKRLVATVAGGVGFTAITVSWLARFNPFAMALISFLFCVLTRGCSVIQSDQITPSMAELLQGIILFFVLGCELFVTYRLKLDSVAADVKGGA